MESNTKFLISEKLKAIYALTDEIIDLVKKEGKTKLRHPFKTKREDIEQAIFKYIETHSAK